MCQVPFYSVFHVWHNSVLTITLQGEYHYYPSLQMRLQGPERLIFHFTQVYLATEHKFLPDPDLNDPWSVVSPYAQNQSENEMTTVLKWGWFGPLRGHLTTSEDIFGCHYQRSTTGISWGEAMWLDQPMHKTAPTTQYYPDPRINSTEVEKPYPWPCHHQ